MDNSLFMQQVFLARYRPTPMMQVMAGTPQIKVFKASLILVIKSIIKSLLGCDYISNPRNVKNNCPGCADTRDNLYIFSPLPERTQSPRRFYKIPNTRSKSNPNTRMITLGIIARSIPKTKKPSWCLYQWQMFIIVSLLPNSSESVGL